MLNDKSLKKEFDHVKWERGYEYAKRDMVQITSLDTGYIGRKNEEEPVIGVSAKVKGKGNISYDVDIIFRENRIEQASCTCQDYTNGYYQWSPRYCKHIAATAIVACKNINHEEHDLYTGRSAHRLMELYTKDAVIQIANQSMDELVGLEPCLATTHTYNIWGYLQNTWKVSFKIGKNKKYVVKNLTTFYEMMKQNQEHSYGKDFTILHNEDVFDEASKPLLNFILSRVEEAKALSDQSRYGYANEVSIKREITLTPHNISELIENMRGRKIAYTQDDGHGKSKGYATVIDKEPYIELDIEPDYLSKGELAGVKLRVEADNIIEGNYALYQLHDSQICISSEECAKTIGPLMKVINQNENQEIKIGKSLLASFYGDVLPKLSSYIKMDEEKSNTIRESLPEKANIEFYFDTNAAKNIVCKIEVSCENEVLEFLNEKQAIKYSYYVDRAKIITIIDKYIEEAKEKEGIFIFSNDEDLVFDFLYKGIELLSEFGTIHGTERFKNMNVKRAPKITVGVQMKSDLLNLQIDTEDFDLRELKEILQSYHRKKKYHRLKNGSFMNIEDDGVQQLADLVEGLHLNDKELIKGNIHIPAYRALYIDRVLQESQGIEYERNQKFKGLVRAFKSVEDSDYEVPSELKSILRNYQKVGYRWLRLLQSYGLGGILADDMGLGKTLQVIALLLSFKNDKKEKTSIVISPASLVYNWEREFEKFAPELMIGVVAGTPTERQEMIENSSAYDVLITSYDLARRDIEYYEEKEFFYEIIDEAQYIKNHTTLVAKSVKIIKATHKLALTGTPIENRLSELWSIFDYLMPGFLYTYDKFRKEMESPIVKSSDELIVARLKKLVSPFILRRLKKDVLKDLPDKIEEITYAKLEKTQQQVYSAYVAKVKEEMDGQAEGEFEKNKLKILSELTRLRQICCDPSLVYEDYNGESAKLETCIELIQNAIDGGHKILLFSQFTSMLRIIGERLSKSGISFYEITGATPKAKRLQFVEAFNENDIPVFLISLKAGGTGLNLTGADVVIHYDPWWNVAAQNQATDRAHRIGQTNVVTVFQLIAKGTIEEKIVKMQEKKKALADQIISGEENQLSAMTKDDFMSLLNED